MAAGIASGDWDISPNLWLRFLIVAAVATFLVPALQSAANEIDAGDLVLLIAFIVIMFLIKVLIVTELVVSDEWLSTIFASIVTILILYILQRIVSEFWDVDMFSFI